MNTTTVAIYGDINITDLLISLRKEGLEIASIKTSEGDVENYYFDLVKKGGR